LLRLRQSAALVIESSHPERRRPDRDLAPDLAQPDDPDGRAVEGVQAGNAWPVGIGRMAPVEPLVAIAGRRELLAASADDEAMVLRGHREHHRERKLGIGDVGAPAYGQDLDAPGGACGEFDVTRLRAVFLHHAQVAAGGKLSLADTERLDHERAT